MKKLLLSLLLLPTLAFGDNKLEWTASPDTTKIRIYKGNPEYYNFATGASLIGDAFTVRSSGSLKQNI
ncbi:MAG: hypothetical protein M3O09_00050 [Acidobacteriota bacterium]|nr:hypothetical protein [Acidobacteriota bacterium]